MKVLLSMPADGQTNQYIDNALRDLGHEVLFVDHQKHLPEKKDIVEFVFTQKPELFLALHLKPGETYSSDTLEYLKLSCRNTKFVSWFFDTTVNYKMPYEDKNFVDIIKSYDYFFTMCRGQVEEYRKVGVNAFWQFEGVDSYCHDLTKKEQYKYDVSFIGQMGNPNIHSERLPLIMKISKHFPNIGIFGSLVDKDNIILNNTTTSDIEHSRIVAQSKINLCPCFWPDIDLSFSARIYRIAKAGGFCLCRNVVGIEDMFEVGKEIDVYNTEEECLEKISYYLNKKLIREKIAKAGKERVENNYTFKHSVGQLIDRVFN